MLYSCFTVCQNPLGRGDDQHLAPARAEYVQAFAGVNFNAEKISGALFEVSGALSKVRATLKFSGPLFEV